MSRSNHHNEYSTTTDQPTLQRPTLSAASSANNSNGVSPSGGIPSYPGSNSAPRSPSLGMSAAATNGIGAGASGSGAPQSSTQNGGRSPGLGGGAGGASGGDGMSSSASMAAYGSSGGLAAGPPGAVNRSASQEAAAFEANLLYAQQQQQAQQQQGGLPAGHHLTNRPSFNSRRSSVDASGSNSINQNHTAAAQQQQQGRPSLSLEALERVRNNNSNDVGGPSTPGSASHNVASAASMSSLAAAGSSTAYLPSHPSTPAGHTASSSLAGLVAPASGNGEAVHTAFDEATLRALCDLDCGMPLLFDRIKQSMVSAREAATFLKKRAAIEEDYARAMSKLARSSAESYGSSEGKAGSFVGSWVGLMKIHDQLGDSHLRFSQKLGEMSEELSNLAKEVDKQRRFARETGQRLEKSLTEAEQGVEKARTRFDSSAEDLERLLLIKQGESTKAGEIQGAASVTSSKRTLGKAMGKTGLLFKQKNPQQMLRQEEEIRVKTSNASDAFRKEVQQTQQMRQEFFNMQLPRILRSLKESAEEIDNGTQYHLSRYAFLFETLVLSDGMAISPIDPANGAVGLKGCVESIDNRADFKTYMQNYQVAHGREYKGPKREGAYDEGFMPASPTASSRPAAPNQPSQRPIFGVDLATQMARDNVETPPILEKCAEAIEAIGIQSMGIYRLSGTSSKVQRLRSKFDQDWAQVDLMNDEAINDINIVAGCLKLWFRELPEPLLTHELYAGFIEAAKITNYRLRHIRLHERVNELPDANYATLKALMKHLDAIRSEEAVNQMSASNLAIVFGPTLLSPPMPAGDANSGTAGALHLQDMSFQCKAIETILEKYREIFVEDPEE